MADKPTISTQMPNMGPKSELENKPEVPKIKTPAVPSIKKPADDMSTPKKGLTPPKSKMIGQSPDSKKDPTKQAEQLKNPDNKKMAQEMLKINAHGQWSIEKRAPEGVDPDKHERCVMDVKEQGHDVGSAHAICTSSLKKCIMDELMKYADLSPEEMSKIDWKGVGKKIAGAATAGALTAGAMGATPAQADIGHLKHYLKSMHGMNIDGHDVHVAHRDTSPKELKGSPNGSGKFSIIVGDYKINGNYAGTGHGEHNKLSISDPTHVKAGHAPFEGDLMTRGDSAAEQLHSILSGQAEDTKGLSLQDKLLQERKPGHGDRGLNISDFNVNKSEDDEEEMEKEVVDIKTKREFTPKDEARRAKRQQRSGQLSVPRTQPTVVPDTEDDVEYKNRWRKIKNS